MSNVWITDKDFSCSLAATSNITLSGLYTLDGVAITAGMTVLAAGQTDPTASGPYIAKLGVWDRVISLATGQQFYIALGSANGTKIFELQTPIPFTVGVTSLSFVTPIVSGTPPIGTAGGDLSGTYPNPKVLGFNGKPLTASAPATGSQIVFDGTTWQYQMGVSGPPSGPAGGDLAGSYPNPTVATGLSATKIADGSVSNAEFQYLDGVTSGIQSQIDGKLSSSSTKLPPTPTGAGKLIYDNGTAYVENTAGTTDQVLVGGSAPAFGNVPPAALTSVPAASLTGTIGIANIPTGTSSSTVTIGNDSRLPPTPTTAGKIPYDTGSAYAETSAGTTNQVLLGGTTPSFGNVPSAALTSVPASALTGTVAEINGGFGSDTSALTAGFLAKTATNTYVTRTLSSGTGTTVTNGAGTAGNPSVNVTYGTGSSTATQGNDTRLSPTPSAAGKVVYDNGSGYTSTAVGTSSQVLHGGVNPSFSAVLLSSDVSGTLPKANGGFGLDVSTGLTNDQVAIVSGNAITIGALTTNAIPSGISATKIGTGTVDNTELGYLDGVTSAIQTQFTGKLDTTSNKLPPTPTAGGKILYDTGSAYAESAAGTSGTQILVSGGTGSPTWGTRGGAVASFVLNTAQSWTANAYLGIGGDGTSTLSNNIVGWRAPAAGTVSNLTVYGLTNTSGSTVITIYKATSATTSPTYSSTTLTCTLGTGTNNGSDTTHSFTVNAGDLIVAFSSASWSVNGACVNVMWYPT